MFGDRVGKTMALIITWSIDYSKIVTACAFYRHLLKGHCQSLESSNLIFQTTEIILDQSKPINLKTNIIFFETFFQFVLILMLLKYIVL